MQMHLLSFLVLVRSFVAQLAPKSAKQAKLAKVPIVSTPRDEGQAQSAIPRHLPLPPVPRAIYPRVIMAMPNHHNALVCSATKALTGRLALFAQSHTAPKPSFSTHMHATM
jgi:hypothetical protein